MKKLLLISLLALFMSCNGDDECNCGIIEAKNLDYDMDEGYTWFIDLRNNCTDEIENNIQVTDNIADIYIIGDEICNIERLLD